MALPTIYTDAELKAFMLAAVGNLATVLDLTVSSFDEAINETLFAYEADTLADATSMKKLRALARVEAWKVAVAQATGVYNFASHDGRYERKAIYEQAVAGLTSAQVDAAEYAGDAAGYVVGLAQMTYADDPYALIDEDEDAE